MLPETVNLQLITLDNVHYFSTRLRKSTLLNFPGSPGSRSLKSAADSFSDFAKNAGSNSASESTDVITPTALKQLSPARASIFKKEAGDFKKVATAGETSTESVMSDASMESPSN